MKKTGILITIIAVLCAAVLSSSLGIFSFGGVKASADDIIADGKYGVKVSNDMPMGKSNISEDAILEKNGNLCYLTLTFKRTAIDNPVLKIDGKNAGQVVAADDGKYLSVTYTLSQTNAFKPLTMTVLVVPMKTTKSVTVTVDKSSAVKTGEFDTTVKRAPEFVTDDKTIEKRDYSSDMPAWGYAIIAVVCVAAIVAFIIIILRVLKRKRRRSEL